MSNTAVRIIVGVIGIPIFLFLIITGGIPFFCLTALIACIGLWEFHKLFLKKDVSTFLILDICAAGLFLSICYFFIFPYLVLLYIMPVIIFTAELFRKKKNVFNPLASLVSQFYITFPLILLNGITQLYPGTGMMNYVLIVFVLIWTCDTMSFFGGKLIGKHKLTEISPKKTIEGLISGIIFTIIASFIIMYFNKELLNFKDAIVFGLIVALASPAGDIFESFIKRSADIKDSSNIIPGHGGVLDRFDSLLFVVPFIYTYLHYFKSPVMFHINGHP